MVIIQHFLKMIGRKYLLDDGTNLEDRVGHIRLYNAPGSECKTFTLAVFWWSWPRFSDR